VLAESAARWILVLHTALGVAAVGAATHLVIWLRRYLRGRTSRRSVQKFAVIALVLHAAAFVAGNVMYPTYKTAVRAAYLENATAVVGDRDARTRDLARLAEREHAPAPEVAPAGDLVRSAAQQARWFDVKEHWIALGLIASIALVLMLVLGDPERAAPGVLALAYIVAGTLWLGAIIGVLTSSWRAV
jgi:DMSO reductase anchor subunit